MFREMDGIKGRQNFIRCLIIIILLAVVIITCMVLIQTHGKRELLYVNDGNDSETENYTVYSSQSYDDDDLYYLFSSSGK